MKKETTYQKYKRENKQLKMIIFNEVYRFCLSKDINAFQRRLDYISKCINQYRGEEE